MAVSERLTSSDAAALEFLELAQQRAWPTMQEKRAVQLIREHASANTDCLSCKNRFGGVQAERGRVCTAQIRALTKKDDQRLHQASWKLPKRSFQWEWMTKGIAKGFWRLLSVCYLSKCSSALQSFVVACSDECALARGASSQKPHRCSHDRLPASLTISANDLRTVCAAEKWAAIWVIHVWGFFRSGKAQ